MICEMIWMICEMLWRAKTIILERMIASNLAGSRRPLAVLTHRRIYRPPTCRPKRTTIDRIVGCDLLGFSVGRAWASGVLTRNARLELDSRGRQRESIAVRPPSPRNQV